MSIKSFEVGQDFLHQGTIFRTQHFYLGLQCIGQHIAIAAHQLKTLDIQFFEYLFAQTMQCLFLIQAGNTHIKCVERLAYFDLRLLTGRATKANDTHNQVRFACQLLIDKFLIDLWPVTHVYA